jgi:hypothetical protein
LTSLENKIAGIPIPATTLTDRTTLSCDSAPSQQQQTSMLNDFCREMKLRDAKKCNVIISGLQPALHTSDIDLASNIFRELNVVVLPAYVKRIGKSSFGKPPLLLVSLKSEIDRNNIIRNVKRLRQSADVYIRENIFVNPDRTRLEIDEFKQRRARRATSDSHATHVKQPVDRVHRDSPNI